MRDTRDIQIKTLTRQELYQYINSEDYQALKTVPITPHRALSQIRNPRAGDEDVLLLMAFEGEEHIGYLGVLPDYIHFSGSSCKAGWLSCLWISPGSMGKGVAKQLLSKAFECWN